MMTLEMTAQPTEGIGDSLILIQIAEADSLTLLRRIKSLTLIMIEKEYTQILMSTG